MAPAAREQVPPVAVVTGANRRLGLAIAQALLERGYRVLALYRTRTGELEELERRGAAAYAVDLEDRQSLLATLSAIRDAHPRINLLVNNASRFESDPTDPLARADLYESLYRINVLAPYLLTEGLKDALAAAGDGQVINITDIYAEKPNPRFAAYCSTKAALANLTLSHARSLAPGVRVNAIMPGPIKFLPSHQAQEKQAVMDETLLAREGGFEAVVKMLLALIDNDFMTGAAIPVDGGRRLA